MRKDCNIALRLVAAALVLDCVHGFSGLKLPSLQRARVAGQGRRGDGNCSPVMQGAEESWNLGRFAKTFSFFNGNPLLKLIPFVPSKEPSVRQPPPVSVSSKELVLWRFDGTDKTTFDNMWAPLDDVVMGGVSVSSIKLADHGATLAGETSSRNNGGFCSARSRNCDPPFDISGYSRLCMKVRCDKGMRYKVILRDESGWDTIAWCYSFDTKAGQWMELNAPLEQFIPVFRGSTLRNAPRDIDKRKIYSVQLMLSKYEYDGALNPNFSEGCFALDFGNIRVLK